MAATERKPFVCVICNERIEGQWGNNPAPIKSDGRCCNDCNTSRVIVARIRRLYVMGGRQ